MAEIRKIDIENNEILVNLKISKHEYEQLKQKTDNMILIPSGPDVFNQTLTTGRLGNGNRIMLPKKILEKENVKTLQKKVPVRIFKTNGGVYLLIRLEESQTGIPKFKEQ